MKAMKKILFLTLIFALALSATAFAGTTDANLHTYDEIKAVIDYLDSHEGKCECGTKVKGTWTPWASVVADCTLNASIDAYCPSETCDNYWIGATKSAAKAHTWGTAVVDETKTVAPTCITAGKVTEVVKCEKCAVTTETVTSNTPAAYGHDLLNALMAEKGVNLPDYDASKPMTKDQAKAIEASIKFWNDNYKTHTIAEEKEASWRFQGEHLKAKYVAPDACEAGYIKIWCDYCDKVLFEQEFAGEHDYQWTANYISAFPTCDTPGEVYVKCSKCNDQLKVYLPAYGHKVTNAVHVLQNGEIVAFRHTVDGKVEYVDLDGKKFVECEAFQLVYPCTWRDLTLEELTLEITKYIENIQKDKNVNWSANLTNDLVLALVKNLQSVNISASACDYVKYADGGKIQPALWDHVYDLNNLSLGKDGEFTKYGYFAGNCYEPEHYFLRCNGCEKWTDKVVGAEPAHEWEALEKGEVTKAATCSANGEIKLECTVANCEGTTTVTTDKLPHKLYWEHTGDCTHNGQLIEKCKVCKEEVTVIDVKAWHDPAKRTYATDYGTNVELVKEVNDNGLVAHIFDLKDCTKDGVVKYTCGQCGTSVEEPISKTGHIYNLDKFVEDLKDGKLQNNGEDKAYEIRGDKEEAKDASAFNTKANDGIVEPTCSTYGYVYLECMNPNCDQVAKIKYAEKLNHFDKLAKDENGKVIGEQIVASSCTEQGTVTKVCLCGYTETTDLPLAPHTPTKIDGKDVCLVCGTELKLETAHKYSIQTTEMKVTSTGVSGRGVIDTKEGKPVNHKELFARINYNFTLDNGETVAYVACVPVDMTDGSFRAASPSCPYGATLTNVAIMITTDADAQDKVISDVANLGISVIK